MGEALRKHWPEYLMEATELGIFMIAACAVWVWLEYPGSKLHQALTDSTFRRILGGLAMGCTAVAIIYSPWGKRSGAHFNPSVTLTFLRLGKIRGWDALFYVIAQFLGGIAGVLIAASILAGALSHPSVNYVATVPGRGGPATAFVAETTISFVLFMIILTVSNHSRLSRYTGLFGGALVAFYIAIESPISGMSMNPARTLSSAIPAHVWNSLWIYFTAPPIGMLLAAEIRLRRRGLHSIICAKLHHQNDQRCIFRCGYAKADAETHRPRAEQVA